MPFWFSAFTISVIALFLSTPFFLWGLHPLSELASRTDHLASLFADQLSDGILIPRWLPSMNAGRGSPVFFFEPPFAYYFRSLLDILFSRSALSQVDVMMSGTHAAFTLMLSALAFFLWLVRIAHTRVAFYGALVYTILPTHFVLHTVVENASNLQWVYVWMPLCLRCVDSIQLRKRTGYLGLTLVFFCFCLSSPVTAVCFYLLVCAYVFLCPMQIREQGSYSANVSRLLLYVIYAGLVGLACAAFYLVPAVEMGSATVLVERSSALFFRQEYLFGAELKPSISAYADIAVVSALVFASSFYFSSASLLDKDTKRFVTFWLGSVGVACLLMTEVADFLWQSLDFAPFLQTPAAVSPICCLGIAALVPAVDTALSETARRSVGIFALVIGVCLLSFSILTACYLWTQPSVARPTNSEIFTDPFLPISAVQSELPVASLVEGPSVTAALLSRGARAIQFRVSSPLDSHVVLGQYYLPFWYARIRDHALRLRVEPSAEEGLLDVLVPPGEFEVDVVFARTPGEIAGQSVTIVSVAVWMLLLILSAYFSGREKIIPEEDVRDPELDADLDSPIDAA